jgi:hypothetical protein
VSPEGDRKDPAMSYEGYADQAGFYLIFELAKGQFMTSA